MQISATPTASTAYKASLYQTVTLTGGKTYSLSAYIRTEPNGGSWSYGGAYLYFANGSGTILRSSDVITFDTGEIENGWMCIFVSYTPTASGSYRVGICLDNAKGSVDVDDMQLERGEAPNAYNLLQNSSAEFWRLDNRIRNGEQPEVRNRYD